MNAPNRSAHVAAWIAAHRDLFKSQPRINPDDIRRELLIPLAQALNQMEGRNQWGRLKKGDGFIPHDILVWRDTLEHFDVFTGAEVVENTQANWGENGIIRPGWTFSEVPDLASEPPQTPPVEPPAWPADAELLMRVATLEGRIVTLEQQTAKTWESIAGIVNKMADRISALENKPVTIFELPALIVKGNTSRVWGHGHSVELTVERKTER